MSNLTAEQIEVPDLEAESRELWRDARNLIARIDAHIDGLAERDFKRYPTIPKQVLRNLLTKENPCVCFILQEANKKR